MSDDIEFVDGLIVKAPHENAPDFVKCSLSIKRKELGNWLRGKEDEWINLDVKESKGGKWYAQVNTFKPSADKSVAHEEAESAPEFMDDDVPF